MSNALRSCVRHNSNPKAEHSSSSTFRLHECHNENENDTNTIGSNEEINSTREGSIYDAETADTLYFEPRKVYKFGNGSPTHSSLVRIYSENEKGNFDYATGTRIFDDMRHRPVYSTSKISSTDDPGTLAGHSRRYSMNESEENSRKRNIDDMQDEYIPEFDFADVINKWQAEDDEKCYSGGLKNSRKNLTRPQKSVASAVSSSKYTSDLLCRDEWNPYRDINSGSTSPNSLYVLDSSHAQVDPIPLPNRSGPIPIVRGTNENNIEASSDESADTSRNGIRSSSVILMNPFQETEPSRRKTVAAESFNSASSGSIQLPDNTISVITELKMTPEEVTEFIEKLPQDFLFMPYSSRKKFIVDTIPNKDYKLIMSLIKKFLLKSSKSSSSIGKSSIPGPPTGIRSRHGSVASQYLSSFSPANVSSVASINSIKPDDKGMEVIGHRLGKVIGFGAWGMIRECYDTQSGTVRAMKIVRFRNNYKVKKQVLREVKIWQELKNENILRLLKWKMDDDYAVYCLSEKIRDGTLYDLVISWGEYTNSKISLVSRCHTTIRLCLQVISALKYMHSKSIVHGDIKLENCLLDKGSSSAYWRVLVCDFGMGCHFASHDHDYKQQVKSTMLKSNTHSNFIGFESISPMEGREVSTQKITTIPTSRSISNDHFHGSVDRKSSDSLKTTKGRKLLDTFAPFGVSSLPRNYGPSLTSARIGNSSSPSLQTLEKSSLSWSKLAPTMDLTSPHRNDDKNLKNMGPDPNSHIGSLPYAAPELLEPSPPPLGPPADIWALGVMLYTMLTGKLPFKHDYEPRLRAMIAAGKYDRGSLAAVCCDKKDGQKVNFQGIYDAVVGCLTVNMAKRWDLDTLKSALRDELNDV